MTKRSLVLALACVGAGACGVREYVVSDSTGMSVEDDDAQLEGGDDEESSGSSTGGDADEPEVATTSGETSRTRRDR